VGLCVSSILEVAFTSLAPPIERPVRHEHPPAHQAQPAFPALVDGLEREDATAVRLAVGMLGLLVVFLYTAGTTEVRQAPRLCDIDLEILPAVPARVTGLSLAH